LHLQAEHMVTVAAKVKRTWGAEEAKVGLAVSWMDSAAEFEGNYSHPIFLLNWIDAKFEPQPQTYFRLWLVAERNDKEKDELGRGLVFQMVELLERFGIEVLAVTLGEGFEKQGTFPVDEVAMVRSELIEEIEENNNETPLEDNMDTTA
jgi:hypothetical protein